MASSWTCGYHRAAHWRYGSSRQPLTRERVLATVAFLFHLGTALFKVLAPEGWRTVVRAVRMYPYSRGRATLTERAEQVRLHAKHLHGARALGSADARVAVQGPRLFFIQDATEIGGFEALLTRCVPFLFSLPPTGSRLTRRDLHAPLHAQALPCCYHLHPGRHVRPARRPLSPPFITTHDNFATPPSPPARSPFCTSPTAWGWRARAAERACPGALGTMFGLAALGTDPQFGAGVMYDILALTLVQRRL
jgi:hypothetical protein